mmetsp:Transcript_31611/g.62521  ORF Transcript_31611/g.62521 Transcript_31611/m.62521 type:complete len:147 (-) Transcript_31611:3830-4270(-)
MREREEKTGSNSAGPVKRTSDLWVTTYSPLLHHKVPFLENKSIKRALGHLERERPISRLTLPSLCLESCLLASLSQSAILKQNEKKSAFATATHPATSHAMQSLNGTWREEEGGEGSSTLTPPFNLKAFLHQRERKTHPPALTDRH